MNKGIKILARIVEGVEIYAIIIIAIVSIFK
jgi:hypothetical protein